MGRWIWGVIILAIISLLLAMLGPWSANARSAQMGQSIESAFKAAGYDSFANVDMSGNVATITGEAGSDALMADAINLAKNTECETCKKKGKIWHEVSNEMTVKKAPELPAVSPFVFNATKSDDGSVLVDGYVRNEAERTRILKEANALFSNVTDNKVEIARGAPNPSWGDAISAALGNLATLDSGSASLNDSQILIRGVTTDESIRSSVNTAVQSLPGDFNGAANIIVPNTAAVNVGEVRSEGLCQTLFNDLKGDAKINFAVDKAEITGAQSYDLLNTLASAANQCASFRIRVEGHTDADGEADYNQWLSEARAGAVVQYLADNGVETSRLTGIGYGEERPLASNDTPEGKAANRRIEFIVTTSE